MRGLRRRRPVRRLGQTAKNVDQRPALDAILAVGHHHFPRLRLELKTTVSWREDVEVALERLLGSMTPERALRLA